MTVEYKVLSVSELNHFLIREIREGIVEDLKERIEEGYNPARPLTVVEKDGGYYVADGNHRLKVLNDLGIEEVTCVIHKEEDPYTLAVKGNADEDTYSPMDLFDWVELISKMRDEGLTQQEIGDKIGWSEGNVKKYSMLLNKVPRILEKAKQHQEGRGTSLVPNGTFNFTEGWFRNSGLYDLDEKHQQQLMEWFIDERKGKPSNKQVQQKTESLLEIQNQLEYVEENLRLEDKKEDLVKAVSSGEYTDSRLKEVIERYNDGAKNKAIFGVDTLEQLRKMESNSVDLVVTDPPYGADYVPSRTTGRPKFEDGEEETLELLDEVFKEIKRVAKSNAHIYVFTGYLIGFEVKQLLKKHFDVQDNWITWVKNNHTLCNFKQRYASKYEIIWFAKMENGDQRELNAKVSPDVIHADVPRNRYHDTQKPKELLKHLILNSSSKGEVVLDPFMGSGSTMLAAAELERYFVGFELETEYEPKFKRLLGEI